MNTIRILLSIVLIVTLISCKKKETNTPLEPKLIFKFKFDSTQVRLNSTGNISILPTGHGALSPIFNSMSAHYIELAPSALTQLGNGEVVYKAAETSTGGANAINFDLSTKAGNNQEFFFIPLSQVSNGTYEWLRVSLAYQNYDIKFKALGYNLKGTIASFIGFNSYVGSFKIKDSTMNINSNKAQGFWALETPYAIYSGQAPIGATTVVNPISSTSPIPSGSCVVTASFSQPLVISGNETNDIIIIVSLSTNKSFEWVDVANNNIYEPLDGDQVVDMGIRGMIPLIQ
jgi:hypothetical protein